MTKSEVVQHFGTQQAVADAHGVTIGAVSQWKEDLPANRQALIELMTGGKLKADLPTRGKYRKKYAHTA